MIRSRCLYSLIVTCTVLFPMATPALAQGERRFYVGAELRNPLIVCGDHDG